MLMQVGVLLEMARISSGSKVLDYGCGTGRLARSLGYLGCEVEGVDVSETAISVGRDIILNDPLSSGATVNLRVTDGIHLPYPDCYFNRIVCFSAFHHVANQEETLREMHRVLRDGGISSREPKERQR
jgi:ubiquinone/menaquinone biosynthesis C-methylase UbiE